MSSVTFFWKNEHENIKDPDPFMIEDMIIHQLQGQSAISGPLNAHFKMRRWDDSDEFVDERLHFWIGKLLPSKNKDYEP